MDHNLRINKRNGIGIEYINVVNIKYKYSIDKREMESREYNESWNYK